MIIEIIFGSIGASIIIIIIIYSSFYYRDYKFDKELSNAGMEMKEK